MKLLGSPHLLGERSRARLGPAWSRACRSSALWVFLLGALLSWLLTAALHLAGGLGLVVQFLFSIPPAVAVLLILDSREQRSGLWHDVRQARSALASAQIWRGHPSPVRRTVIRVMCVLLRVTPRRFEDPE